MRLAERKYFTTTKFDRFERIIEATKKRLAEVGADRLTIRDLAVASQVSAATLYNRFGSKDNIISVVVIDHFEQVVRLALSKENGAREPPVARILHVLKLLERNTCDNRGLVQALMSIHFKIDSNEELRDQLFLQCYELLLGMVEDLYAGKALSNSIPVALLVEEATDKIFSVVLKWAQQKFPNEQLLDRLILGVLSVLVAGSQGRGLVELENELNAAASRISAAPLQKKNSKPAAGKKTAAAVPRAAHRSGGVRAPK
ncbi:MAG: regulatory protein TetR [Hydrocarboniphaga sp.]|uniref:TetR/AcrR family transcriptional regulator n=1 Tax=Hydrocarboniphaga sp. TaxID=2033016 RepID=UPI002632FB62|nr:TetR/AcrR family transcriptional regulator [Hydrocarboniphaga sp.]MDB5968388.1 regulatory protein TetR [Hydrocarboniphaga sp.]